MSRVRNTSTNQHILFLVSINDNERDDSQIVADSC